MSQHTLDNPDRPQSNPQDTPEPQADHESRAAEAEALLEAHRAERLARQTLVRNHPLYPTLFRKVAAHEAAGLHPIRRRYRNSLTYGWQNTLATVNRDGTTTWPGRRSAYPTRKPIEVAYEISAKIIPDLVAAGAFAPETLTETWYFKDAQAYCYVLARDFVRARIDDRTPTWTPG